MSSIFPYIPSVGALMGYGIHTLAQSISQTPPGTAAGTRQDKPAGRTDIAAALNDQPAIKPDARFSSATITLNNGNGLDIDNAARLLIPSAPAGTATSLRGIEIINSATAKTVGERNGFTSTGLAPVWLENHGSITGKNGAGVRLDGDQDDEVVNAGLIIGSHGVALSMGGGNDMLIVRSGGRFEGVVDGGSGTNQVILDDARGGTFDGARQMQHLWVGSGNWTLTGEVPVNQQGAVYSGATLVNQSKIGGSMTVQPDATYAGGTVANLEVAGTLRLDPATHVEQDLRMEHGSTLALTLGADQTHTPSNIGNTADLRGATLAIHVENENDALLSQPLQLLSAKHVESPLAGITSNLKTLVPTLTYRPDGVFVTFKRNDPTA